MNYEEKYKLERELTISIMRSEYAYIHFSGEKAMAYKLPSPQRAGTGYQQETYARLKAKELIKDTCLDSDITEFLKEHGGSRVHLGTVNGVKELIKKFIKLKL
jgi:hypothetical protein